MNEYKEHIMELINEILVDQRIEEKCEKTLPAYLRYLEDPYRDNEDW